MASPVIAATARSGLVDIRRQGAPNLTDIVGFYTSSRGEKLLVKELDPYLAWGLSERRKTGVQPHSSGWGGAGSNLGGTMFEAGRNIQSFKGLRIIGLHRGSLLQSPMRRQLPRIP